MLFYLGNFLHLLFLAGKELICVGSCGIFFIYLSTTLVCMHRQGVGVLFIFKVSAV